MKKRLMAGALLASLSVQAQTSDLPEPVKQIEKQGITIIKPFTAPGGVQGWLGKYQDTGVTLYLTPDKKHVISGYMYDAQGNNLSEKIINEEIYIPAGREMWKTLTKATGIKEGSDQAGCPVVVFADPFCPYCHTFWQQAQPLVKEKRISLKTLLVGVLRPDSGRYAAAVLASDNPAGAWQALQASKGKNKPTLPEKTSQAAFKQIQHNQYLMDQLGANGTPAIYYLNKDQALQQIVGLPDAQQMARLAACE
ncbi:thiol:disulfide interchange protein DsbG [Cronobacter muytjensii]|uniref:Thiol:disulfide interchange protein n=1 Tax=Cronobacter muytjensii TaxID=413501 RepID=A0A2T7AJU2_9ENTR|nr:thiol:disulfide interchange protein DsbG [Cronobacter muytjensii]EKS1846054.1 thiol:disulfide interchange protein DsbG [Cronobacter muytjensii]ELY3985844.1 thiol:disulfide interchange protein DsbG [Cronobacter muytjensii]ELY4665176.1 thiol:disulfide interchange protein DsbG [Cronobacter muytjensii]ELY4673507.1 thiol:disulfide interchange protein DsbG [Cronobacter muytjensii]ELY6276876.1 thiol:disulfide interchange protein DsbG [Cronobacter muytjensii]